MKHTLVHRTARTVHWSQRIALDFVLVLASVLASSAFADERPAVDGRLIDVDGSRLWVQSEGSGPPIVFLHGGMQFFESSFAGQRAYFAAFRQVVGIDQAGHGHSPDDERPFGYQRMADRTAAVLQRLALGPVDVVGESDGGDVGLLLAHDHPELVRRLVVSGANLRAGLPPDELERRSHWTDAQVAEKLRTFDAALPPRFRTNYQAVTPDGPGHWPVLLAKSYRLWLTPVVVPPSALKGIAAPTLVIAGDDDFTSLEETTELWRGLPHGQLMIVPGTGHGTFHDRPALLNLAIREFLEAAPRP